MLMWFLILMGICFVIAYFQGQAKKVKEREELNRLLNHSQKKQQKHRKRIVSVSELERITTFKEPDVVKDVAEAIIEGKDTVEIDVNKYKEMRKRQIKYNIDRKNIV